MNNKQWYKYLIDYIAITIGTVIMAISLNMFLEPNMIAPGGVTGLAIVIQKLTNGFLKIDVTNLLINVPLFIVGVLTLGKAFGAKTLYATFGLSFFIRILPHNVATTNLLLASIFGGVLIGIGIGMVFKFGGTTGGTDLGGAILHKYIPSFSIAKLMMFIDLMVVIFAGLVDRKLDTALYSIIALYILVKVIDQIMEGLSYTKAFLIISEKPQEIGEAILNEIDRGATILKGKGMYTGLDRDTLLCVVNRAEIIKLKELIHRLDNRAFVMVTDIHEVLGEGFKEIKSN
ncbi:YitT family protein [Clostridium sp. D2Q-11]|uniref:YitT family protein n=1 Tax=Anaeromonas frigoriresistens TaxID=2683708 RepID=A0A942Z5H0_9FIRM|nr:YitT family protein [Anaeromonas frigoriresistens]MBS4537426.1 YitT family protein [Anaeromonas frigoriresistens]